MTISAFPVLERGGNGLELTDPGMAQREIAARFGVSQQTISGIKAGKRWGHVE